MTPEQQERWATPERIRELARERFKPWPLYEPTVVKPVRDRKPKQLRPAEAPHA
jgi:hypothetical protein